MEGVSDIVNSPASSPMTSCTGSDHTCVVIPSLYEPFGIVALEGMAAGAPTIVARTGGLAEIVEGTDAGLLFEPGNHHELADRIAELIAAPELGAGLRERAAELLAGTYTWDAIAAKTVEVYRVATRAS
jgi:glycogen(starch) synthase